MESRPSQIVLVRHGETEWSRSGQHTGTTDLPLTERGREQAAAIGERLAGRPFARVITSPLSRAMETCRIAGLGARAVIDPGLAEWRYGSYEGRTTADIRSEVEGWTVWRDGAPGGESAADVGERVDRVLEGLGDVEGEVALFAHGHVLRVLGARWLGLAPEDGRLLTLGTGTLCVLGWERETRAILVWNAP